MVTLWSRDSKFREHPFGSLHWEALRFLLNFGSFPVRRSKHTREIVIPNFIREILLKRDSQPRAGGAQTVSSGMVAGGRGSGERWWCSMELAVTCACTSTRHAHADCDTMRGEPRLANVQRCSGLRWAQHGVRAVWRWRCPFVSPWRVLARALPFVLRPWCGGARNKTAARAAG